MGQNRTTPPGKTGNMGRNRQGQQEIRQCRILDLENGGAMARFVSGIRRVEQYAPPLHPMAGCGRLGAAAGSLHRRTGLGMAHGGCQLRQSPPARGGGQGGNEGIGLTKGGETPRYIWLLIHMVYRSEALSRRVQSLIAHRLCASWQDGRPRCS